MIQLGWESNPHQHELFLNVYILNRLCHPTQPKSCHCHFQNVIQIFNLQKPPKWQTCTQTIKQLSYRAFGSVCVCVCFFGNFVTMFDITYSPQFTKLLFYLHACVFIIRKAHVFFLRFYYVLCGFENLKNLWVYAVYFDGYHKSKCMQIPLTIFFAYG